MSNLNTCFKSCLYATFAVLSIVLFAPNANAQNVQFVYSVTGGSSWTWIEPASPTPTSYVDNNYFDIAGVFGDPSGGAADLRFFTENKGGGFNAYNPVSDSITASFLSSQLYSGPLSSPTFLLGTFTGTDDILEVVRDATLVISAVAVPEPSTYAVLAGTLAMGALAAAKRRKVTV